MMIFMTVLAVLGWQLAFDIGKCTIINNEE